MSAWTKVNVSEENVRYPDDLPNKVHWLVYKQHHGKKDFPHLQGDMHPSQGHL